MTTGGTSRGESGKSQVSEGGGEKVTTDSVALGDVIYIRLRGGSWWPAQVVDEKSVNESIKLSKKSAAEVLVRLYGSYKYSYADPIKCRSEFEKVLKLNDGSYRKILQQALEKDLPSTKACRSKASSSKTKGTGKSPASKRKSDKKDGEQNKVKRQKQNKMLNDGDQGSQNPESPSLGKPQELSARRIRVMESLGLIAPPGSPFLKNGRRYNQSS